MKTIGMLVAVEVEAGLSLYGTATQTERRCGFTVYTYREGDRETVTDVS